MKIISIFVFLLLLISLPSIFADETKTFFVNPNLVDCVGVGPQKCMLISENSNHDWHNFYDKIEGFDFVEGYNYKIIVDVSIIENPPADASNLKYKLIEIIEKSPNHHFPYQNMCAPGFVPLGKICVLNDRCGPSVYPGKICVIDGKVQPYLRPLQQGRAGIMPDEIICAEHLSLVFRHDSSPACVRKSSIEKLESRGWFSEKPSITCTQKLDPVCGMDEKTYRNICLLNKDEIELKHTGECKIFTEFELNEQYQSIQNTISMISSDIYNGKYNGNLSLEEVLEKLEEAKNNLNVIKKQYDSLDNDSKNDKQIAMRFLTLGKMGLTSLDSQINIIKNQIPETFP